MLLDEVTRLQGCLCTDGEMFCQRLRRLVDEAKAGDTCRKNMR
jgi:hypothetical protein